jgi:hypothetical protein
MSEYVFNNACATPLLSSPETVRIQLAELLRGMALFEAEEQDGLPMLRLDSNPWLYNIAEDTNGRRYSIGEIALQMYETPDHDVATFFEALVQAIPSDMGLDKWSVDSILRIEPTGPAAGIEDTYESAKAAGVDGILCALASFILISLPTSTLWRFNLMGFQVGSSSYQFDHISCSEHAIQIRSRRTDAIRGALRCNNFWKLRDHAFPHLKFGLDVEDQIGSFSTVYFSLALKRLAELNDRARRWREPSCNTFPEGTTPITPESEQTMKRYAQTRNFRGHDGVIRTFEEHMWIDPGNRIHLIRHSTVRIVEVGYIGRHLPTINYRT